MSLFSHFYRVIIASYQTKMIIPPAFMPAGIYDIVFACMFVTLFISPVEFTSKFGFL